MNHEGVDPYGSLHHARSGIANQVGRDVEDYGAELTMIAERGQKSWMRENTQEHMGKLRGLLVDLPLKFVHADPG